VPGAIHRSGHAGYMLFFLWFTDYLFPSIVYDLFSSLRFQEQRVREVQDKVTVCLSYEILLFLTASTASIPWRWEIV